MKINKSKFVVGALLSLVSVSIAGSVVGTAAWYTYNTKDSVTFHGIASGNSENLQIKIKGEDATEYRSDITAEELVAYSTTIHGGDAHAHSGADLAPVSINKTVSATPGSPLVDGDFISAPAYLETNTSKAPLDQNGNYQFFKADLDLRCQDPVNPSQYYAKDVYISYLKVTATKVTSVESPKKDQILDISNAIRMQISGPSNKNFIIAPGINNSGSIDLFGPLNLGNNPNGANDMGWKQPDGSYKRFKEASTDETKTEVQYGINGVSESYYGLDDTVTTFTDGSATDAKICVGQTTGTSDAITLSITIWLEGWASSMVDANAFAEFDLDMLFQVENL